MKTHGVEIKCIDLKGEPNEPHHDQYRPAHLQQRLHDVCLVRPSQEHESQTLDHRRPGELGIALFEYLLQVPANRIGHTVLSVGQLKILQEVITLTVFVPFSIFYLKEDLKWDYLWAGLCILGAVFLCSAKN